MIIGPTVKGRSDLGENGLAVWPRHGSVDLLPDHPHSCRTHSPPPPRQLVIDGGGVLCACLFALPGKVSLKIFGLFSIHC